LDKLEICTSSEAESITSDDERLHQFISEYGSHYVQAVEHGYRVAIYGRFDSKRDEEVQTFHAAFKAAFASVSAGGGLDTGKRELLSSSRVELRAEIDAGRIEPSQTGILTGFDQIVPFLTELATGKIKLYRGPIGVAAKSYWHTLLPFPKTRNLLTEVEGTPAKAPWGVPARTVIAWSPPPESIRKDAAGSLIIEPPMGWVVCDGRSGSPNLVDRFILGTISGGEIDTFGGAATHSHGESVYTPQLALPTGVFIPDWTGANGPGRAPPFWAPHSHAIAGADNRPPFVKLVYIMKQ
jgi:hypothetical protein